MRLVLDHGKAQRPPKSYSRMTISNELFNTETSSHEMDLTDVVWVEYSAINGKITVEEKLGMRRRATSYVTNQTREGRVWHVGE